ncbi:MAG: STAS/SEC14 domain-containing protein [Amaricoccus sp.]
MLEITDDNAHNCLVLEPSGSLSEGDFQRLTERFNAVVHATDRIPNLVVHAESFPGWTDFGAMLSHLRFIRDHHRLIRKIALVSDARILDFAPKVANTFVAARIRHFPAKSLDDALAWVAEPDEPESHVTVMQGLPDNVVGLSVHGVVGAKDYQDTIVPLIDERLGRHGKLRLVYRIGPEFESFTPGAVWSDTRVGMMHLRDFEKVAVVSDVSWIRHAVRLFAPLIPGHVHVFGDGELAEAKAWIAA